MRMILYAVFSTSVQSPLCGPIRLTNTSKKRGLDEDESTLTSSSVLVLETIVLRDLSKTVLVGLA